MTASTREARGLAERRGLAAAGIATVALTAPALAAEPAPAATYTKGACTSDRLCLWSQGGFANNWRRWSASSEDANYNDNSYTATTHDSEDGLNDTVSAVWNNTNRWAVLFEHNTYGGHRICFPPGTAVRDLHTVQMKAGWIIGGGGTSWGNQISSHWMYGGSTPSDCNPGSPGSTIVPTNQQGCSM